MSQDTVGNGFWSKNRRHHVGTDQNVGALGPTFGKMRRNTIVILFEMGIFSLEYILFGFSEGFGAPICDIVTSDGAVIRTAMLGFIVLSSGEYF